MKGKTIGTILGILAAIAAIAALLYCFRDKLCCKCGKYASIQDEEGEEPCEEPCECDAAEEFKDYADVN